MTPLLATRSGSETEQFLCDLALVCYARGWLMGTSGNFSAVLSSDPLILTITATGLDKGALSPEHFVRVDSNGKLVQGSGRPSAETALHLLLTREHGAAAVLHTHSVWSTIISDRFAEHGGLWIEGYEMLKGLSRVTTHEHREWLPIVENDQDMARVSGVVEQRLREHPKAHGFLLRNHGLYTWGANLEESKRHLEILEFLLEVIGRKAQL